MAKIMVVDGSPRKAWRVLKARLTPFGYKIYHRLNDVLIIALAERYGDNALIATSDKPLYHKLTYTKARALLLDHETVKKRNSRTLATLLIKRLLGRQNSGAMNHQWPGPGRCARVDRALVGSPSHAVAVALSQAERFAPEP